MDYGGTETLLMNLYRNINRDLVQFDFAVSTTTTAPFDCEIRKWVVKYIIILVIRSQIILNTLIGGKIFSKAIKMNIV